MTEPLPNVASLTQQALQAFFARLVVVRLAVAPFLISGMGLAVWLDPAPWRITLATFLVTAVLVLFGSEYVRFRFGASGPNALPINLVLMLWIQVGAVVLTGGLDSPVAPLLPMIALQLALVFGITPPFLAVVGVQVATIWALAVLYEQGVSPAIPILGAGEHGRPWPWIAASFYTFLLAAAALIGSTVRRQVGAVIARAIGAHDSERLAHAEHARELVALTGEIAHELKNPLASIKGLASLLARDVDGKPAERLGVLRAEVDRMQETLQDFLDFSRPLVPLAVAEVDLGALSREVADLCHGMAQAGGVRLQVSGEGKATADRRKLRQVVVNLVQNAIEASASGSVVEVSAADGRVEVLDRGPGIPEEFAACVFDPGVTTRGRGSGLGLTIARGLVAQHDGTLALDARPGGGTRAVVAL